MSNIDIQRSFNDVYKKFNSHKGSLQDVSGLVLSIRENLKLLSENQIVSLLEIPKNIIENDIELKDSIKNDHGYLIGNLLNPTEPGFITTLSQKIKSNDNIPQVSDIVELIQYCRDNIQQTKGVLDFYLRIPEVVLRDYSKLKDEEQFNSDQNIFAVTLKKQLNL